MQWSFSEPSAITSWVIAKIFKINNEKLNFRYGAARNSLALNNHSNRNREVQLCMYGLELAPLKEKLLK